VLDVKRREKAASAKEDEKQDELQDYEEHFLDQRSHLWTELIGSSVVRLVDGQSSNHP
jgi:hypothetical protein